MDGLEQFISKLEDGQAFALLLDRLCGLLPEGHRFPNVELLPLGQLILALPKTAQGLRDGSLARLRPRVFPGPVHVLGDGVQQALLHGLACLAALLRQRGLRGGCAGEAAIRLLDDLDGGQLLPCLGGLATQENGFLLLHFYLEILLDIALGQQAVLLITIEAFMIFEYTRVLQLPCLPHLVFRELLLLPKVLLGRLIIGKFELDASNLPGAWIHFPLPLAHGVGRVVLIFVKVALPGAGLQVIACLLVDLSDGQVQLGPGDANDLDQDVLVAAHPVGCAGHHAGLLGQLAQVAQTLLAALGCLH
mmetsp:Transcript_82218/g.228134  ORF Transcript_82218/g.228134 Transcript_82218/m.228134 type:complete len:305 (+) Transcript_82218:2050-2964(+)